MDVQMRIDANQVKAELNKALNTKIRSIYPNEAVQSEILHLWYDEYIYPFLDLEDTGAFRNASRGVSEKTKYFRHGTKTISPHHGIERDAIEERPNGPHSYFAPLASQRLLLGGAEPNGKNIYNAMHRSDKKAFLMQIKQILTGSMNGDR